MKFHLDVVTFDTDIHGPGGRREASMSQTYARTRQKVGIWLETDLQAVFIELEGAAERPLVVVPWARVRYSEPAPFPTMTERQTPVAKKHKGWPKGKPRSKPAPAPTEETAA